MNTETSTTVKHNLMTIRETAEYLRMPIPSLYYYANRGMLPVIKIGGRWRILRDRLDAEYLQVKKKEPRAQSLSLDQSDLVDRIVKGVVETLTAG